MSKKIYIGLSSPKKETCFSRMIKLVLGTPYSHTYVRWETSWGFDAVYEASGFSVKFVGGDIWHNRNEIYKEWELEIAPEKYHSKFLPYLMSLSGLQYDFYQILSILFYLIFRKKTTDTDSKKMICSEVVYYILTEVFEKDWDIDPDIVTPKDIERYLDVTT